MNSKLIRWIGMVLAALIAVVISLALGQASAVNLSLSVAMAIVVFLALRVAWDRFRKGIAKRMKEDAQGWSVMVNGVKVGAVTDAHYAAMQWSVTQDWRLAFAQLLNVVGSVLKVMGRTLSAVPQVLFWAAVAAAILAPENWIVALEWLRTATPEAISATALNVLGQACVLALLAVGVLGAWSPGRLGFRDVYGEAVNRLLRQHLGITHQEGDLILYKISHIADPGTSGNEKPPAERQVGDMSFSKPKKQLEAIQWALGWHNGGVHKRIDEGRELLELLQTKAPGLLSDHYWIENWIRATDEFMNFLSEKTPIPSSRFPPDNRDPHRIFPRPWPGRFHQQESL